MGKRKRKYPDVEEVLSRPWCYYCERDFEDLKLLISHQKAKHFKCDECGRRLNTAGGLSVHMNQVHKETLNQVENALPNRQGLDVEIFGMEGIPQEILEQHRNRIIQNFYQAQEDRRIATGNPVPGDAKSPRKKVKLETAEELKKRLVEWREKRKAERAAGTDGSAATGAPGAYQQQQQPYPSGQAPYQEQQYGQAGFSPQGTQQPIPQQGFSGYSQPSLPPRPGGSAPAPAGLPQRPGYAGGFWSGAGPPPGSASTVDELVSGASGQGDDIDQLIRMAEAGIKPKRAEGEDAGEPTMEKKSKKEKDKIKMFYSDADISPEEKMVELPRYRFEG